MRIDYSVVELFGGAGGLALAGFKSKAIIN